MGEGELFEAMRLELRRGSLVLAVLARLRSEQYGYPLLRRLETQGLLTSEWREEDRRKKRFYRLSPLGETMLGRLAEEWRGISASLERML